MCEHAVWFWFGSENDPLDYSDDILHATMLLGMNAGLRYDKVQKSRIVHVNINTNQSVTGSIVLTVTERIKKSTVGRQYVLRQWTGSTKMRKSIVTCPFTDLLSWMCIR